MKALYGNREGAPLRAFDSDMGRWLFAFEINDEDWSVVAVHEDTERRPLHIRPDVVRRNVQNRIWTPVNFSRFRIRTSLREEVET